jgi:hypothetical protein
MVGVVAAFWSYTHVDNAADGSRILRLAERIKDEFALLTGEDLELFVDHESLKWGDEQPRVFLTGARGAAVPLGDEVPEVLIADGLTEA